MKKRKEKNWVEEAIYKAIKGGWNPEYLSKDFFQKKNLDKLKFYTIYYPSIDNFLHDPDFFRCLQKELGARESKHKWIRYSKKENPKKYTVINWAHNTILSLWHHFFEGRDLNSFFKELLVYHKKEKIIVPKFQQ